MFDGPEVLENLFQIANNPSRAPHIRISYCGIPFQCKGRPDGGGRRAGDTRSSERRGFGFDAAFEDGAVNEKVVAPLVLGDHAGHFPLQLFGILDQGPVDPLEGEVFKADETAFAGGGEKDDAVAGQSKFTDFVDDFRPLADHVLVVIFRRRLRGGCLLGSDQGGGDKHAERTCDRFGMK